jgi:hypothetical protein
VVELKNNIIPKLIWPKADHPDYRTCEDVSLIDNLSELKRLRTLRPPSSFGLLTRSHAAKGEGSFSANLYISTENVSYIYPPQLEPIVKS